MSDDEDDPFAPRPAQPDMSKEYRLDKSDLMAYTLTDFITAYGGTQAMPPREWQEAEPVDRSHLEAPTPAAPQVAAAEAVSVQPGGAIAQAVPGGSNMPAGISPGDWQCLSCNFINFASRNACKQCGKERPAGVKKVPRGPPAEGWLRGKVRKVDEEKSCAWIACEATWQQYSRDVFAKLGDLGGCGHGDWVDFQVKEGSDGRPYCVVARPAGGGQGAGGGGPQFAGGRGGVLAANAAACGAPEPFGAGRGGMWAAAAPPPMMAPPMLLPIPPPPQQPPPFVPAPSPGQPGAPEVVHVVVPPGAAAGMNINFTSPSGQQVSAVIPLGIEPGMKMTVQVPPAVPLIPVVMGAATAEGAIAAAQIPVLPPPGPPPDLPPPPPQAPTPISPY